jgi:NADPH-dependent 2,4-dienoyl-CoA reductase/sulfur reductase-like enzyme
MSVEPETTLASTSASGPDVDVDVVVIGAGPHGLSAAVHLRRAGVRAHVLGTPMGFWQGMPERMLLRSNTSATNMIEPAGPLSLAAYAETNEKSIQQPLPLSEFIAYGMWVRRMAVPDVDRRRVTLLQRIPGGFDLRLADGAHVRARAVVLACGIAPFEHMPAGFAHLPAERVSHTAHHRDLGAFRGRRVAVVGGGQSALECAALMSESGTSQVDVLVRAPAVVWLRGHGVKKALGRLGPIVYAPTDVGPLWYSRLVAVPDLFRRLPRRAQRRIAARSIRPACSHFVRVRLGDVRVSTGVEIVAAAMDDDTIRVSLSDNSVREVDHLMFATGYRVDVARYGFLRQDVLAQLRAVDGYPVLGRGLESSVPGLHVVGAPAAWSFGPIMRFVSGSWYAGSAVAHEIARRAARGAHR